MRAYEPRKKVALCDQSHKGGAAHPFRVAQRELTKIKGAMPNAQCCILCTLDPNNNKLSFRGIIKLLMKCRYYHTLCSFLAGVDKNELKK